MNLFYGQRLSWVRSSYPLRFKFVLGFLIVWLSAIFFCFQNVTVRVLFTEHNVLGLLQTGGFVPPTPQHSFLLLLMRMLVVVPLMGGMANKLYPLTWQELSQLQRKEQRSLLIQAIACGGLMFLYLALLYVSIGLIPTGIALTLFFTYPAFTALFAWRLFGDLPSQLRWFVMGLVFLGSALTVPHINIANDRQSLIGIITGIASGVTFALYTVLAQKSLTKLHPVPFTWLSFATTLVLSAICLLIWPVPDTELAWRSLWIGSTLSALFTFGGHLLNNMGIQLIGATSAAMISATNPALTVVLAWVTIQETLTGLQVLGVATVSLGVALLSLERR
jgi:drug/metabolite transporter (DMT)-like permease